METIKVAGDVLTVGDRVYAILATRRTVRGVIAGFGTGPRPRVRVTMFASDGAPLDVWVRAMDVYPESRAPESLAAVASGSWPDAEPESDVKVGDRVRVSTAVGLSQVEYYGRVTRVSRPWIYVAERDGGPSSAVGESAVTKIEGCTWCNDPASCGAGPKCDGLHALPPVMPDQPAGLTRAECRRRYGAAPMDLVLAFGEKYRVVEVWKNGQLYVRPLGSRGRNERLTLNPGEWTPVRVVKESFLG